MEDQDATLSDRLSDIKKTINSLVKKEPQNKSVLTLLAEEFLPLFEAIASFVNEHAEYVEGEIAELGERVDAVEPQETQFMPEDAQKFIAHIEACASYLKVLKQTFQTAAPQEAANVDQLLKNGEALVEFIKESIVEAEEEGDDEDSDEDEDEESSVQ